jgi:hypothetical protein
MVVLNYFYNGKKLRKSLGIKVLLKDWNEDSKENPVRRTDPDHRSKNLLLKEKLLEMNKIVQGLNFKDNSQPLSWWRCMFPNWLRKRW